MKTHHFLKTVLTLVFASLVLVSPLASAKKSKEPQDKQIRYLFVQSATQGKITAHQKDADKYLVTLTGVSPYVSYFSDRPHRVAGHLKVEKFEKLWKEKGKNSFREDPPNAELVAVHPEDKIFNYTVELIEAKYDQKAGTVTYAVKPIKGSEMSLPNEATLNHVFLFIDDVCLSCWGG